jgi:hypothetical protein
MKRILLVLSVAALMAVMLVAMAMPAFARPPADRPEANPPSGPPAGGDPGCFGGKNNADHAVNGTIPSGDASAVDNPTATGEEKRTEGAGLSNASDRLDKGCLA